MKRKICVVTGTRAEYGLLNPVIRAIKKNPNLRLDLVVSGMHLLREFGSSFKEIKKDGFKINAIVQMKSNEDTGAGMAISISKGIAGMVKAFKKINPTIVLILGDRTEVLAAAIAAAYMNIPIAHIHGGDKTKAGLDESVRHAITKLAYLHFVASPTSAKRVLRMGEERERIFVVGAPGLDNILNQKLLTINQLKEQFPIDDKGYIILLQHSVTTQPQLADKQIIETLKAITELRVNTIAIYPNSDAGGKSIIQILKNYKNPFIRLYTNIDNKTFLSLMKYSLAVVGNSSSGIIETSALKIPAINIGTRQEGREKSKNVIDVDYDKEQIKEAIKYALNPKFKKSLNSMTSPYGNGNSSIRIAAILANIPITNRLIQKTITY